jgi:hypothetical protein
MPFDGIDGDDERFGDLRVATASDQQGEHAFADAKELSAWLITEGLALEANNDVHQPVSMALAVVKRYARTSIVYYPLDEAPPLDGVVKGEMRAVVEEKDAQGEMRDEQELAALSLHLLQICLIYINTLLLQQVFMDPKQMQMMQAADWRGLTPLFYQHINPYGTFRLDMNERMAIEEEASA